MLIAVEKMRQALFGPPPDECAHHRLRAGRA
jgi:hypothetical protein